MLFRNCDVGKFAPYLNENEAMFVTGSCENSSRKNIITCKDKFVPDFLAEVGGVELDCVIHSQILELPSYIPIFDYDVRNINDFSSSVVGLTLRDIITNPPRRKAGYLRAPKQFRIREEVLNNKAFQGKKAILFCTGSDSLIEALWSQRDEIRLFGTLSKMGFWAVTGFNFSLIRGECAFSHALNLKRSLFSSALAEESGSTVIPHIYTLTPYQLERWMNWFNLNEDVKFFTMNCQLQKSFEERNCIVKSISKILNEFAHLHVILQGFPILYLRYFGEYIDRIHVANSAPIKSALMHQEKIFNINTNSFIDKYSEANTAVLLKRNIHCYRSLIEGIVKQAN